MLQVLRQILWLFAFVHGAGALAFTPNSGNDMPALFKQAYLGQPQIYRPAQCGRNVFELAHLFQARGINLDDAEVLFFLRERRMVSGIPLMTSLVPAAARGGVLRWDFHVVLVAADPAANEAKVVLDLDWRPVLVSVAEYAHSMFPDDTGSRHANILVRSIPLSDYLERLESQQEAVSLLKAVGDLRALNHPLYPTKKLSEYLQIRE